MPRALVVPCAVTARHARATRSGRALAASVGMGCPKGRWLGLCTWASAQCAIVAMGCSMAHLNSEPFHVL
jgi:hypothetical protein